MPGGGALGEEGGDAFLLVGGGAETAEDVGFDGEGFEEGLLFASGDGFQDSGDGQGCERGDGVGEGTDSWEEVGGGDYFVDEAQAEGFRGVDDLRSEHEAERGAAANEACEALGSTVAGDEAELDLGKAEAGFVAGDAEGAGEGEFAATAEGDSVDRGDDRRAGLF